MAEKLHKLRCQGQQHQDDQDADCDVIGNFHDPSPRRPGDNTNSAKREIIPDIREAAGDWGVEMGAA